MYKLNSSLKFYIERMFSNIQPIILNTTGFGFGFSRLYITILPQVSESKHKTQLFIYINIYSNIIYINI